MQPSALRGPVSDRDRLHEAARSLEALVLKQLVTASKAFGGGESAGSSIRADLFASTLADTLAKHGGIGLAAQLERTLAGGAAPAPSPGPQVHLAPAQGLAAPAPATSPAEDDHDHPALPVAGRVTSGFGLRADPFTGVLSAHRGVDVAAPEGSPIRAVAGGVVRSAGPRGGYGEAVEVEHADGSTTLYGHASALLVSAGDRVEAGQEIARVGKSGRATGAHVHFEVREGARAVDPSRALFRYRNALKDSSGRAEVETGAGS